MTQEVSSDKQNEIFPASRLSIAPMLDWTDRHYRSFIRCITRNTLLYSEMITTGALLHGDAERFLNFSASEHPVALQLGGSNPIELAQAAKMAADQGYDEVNLNVGCPSPKVQKGSFGACLMLEPQLVAECIESMKQRVTVPVTVKCRIGVDERDSYEHLYEFIQLVKQAGCNTFIVHARKAWLNGLSPKENREIPPLQYEVVFQLKKDFPELEIVLNGGVSDLTEVSALLSRVDGVMIGREAYQNPAILMQADNMIFGQENTSLTQKQIIERYLPYVEQQLTEGTPLHSMTRHLLGFFKGKPGARQWRRHLSENAVKANSINVLVEALEFVPAD